MIRRATPEDAAAIHALQLRAWLRGYSDFVPVETMLAAAEGSHDPESWRRRLEQGASRTVTVVWDQDGTIAGFGSVAPADAEVVALYVEPAAQGAGVGSALLAELERLLRAAGRAEGVLRVFRDNASAREFYAARGWRDDGDWGPHPGEWAPGRRYRKAL